jgi:hypothetical protein
VRVEQPAPGQTVNNSSSESRTTLVPANSLVTSTEAISLHGDPAFQQLLAKIGLPPVSFTSKKNQSEDRSVLRNHRATAECHKWEPFSR